MRWPLSLVDLGAGWLLLGFVALCALAAALGFLAARSYLRRRLPAEAFLPTPKLSPAGTETKVEIQALIPDSRYIDIDGLRIHYVQSGPKPETSHGAEIVLLHGIGASHFIWRFVFPLLQTRGAGHRITAFDLPGFGKSDKSRKWDYGLDAQTKTLAKALQALEIHNPLLVGSSMGGTIALWLGKLYPEGFKKIAALAPATEADLIPPQIRHLHFASSYMRKALSRKTIKFVLARVLSRPELITEAVVDAYLEPFLDEGDAIAAFFSSTALLTDRRLPNELRDLQSSVLVIYGERDRMVSRRSIDRLLGLLPQARLASHAQGGHHLMEDEPEWLVTQLEDFIKQR